MIFTRRDYSMVMIMLAVVLLGLGYLIVSPMLTQWQQSSALRARLDGDQATARRLIASRVEWQDKRDAARATLPVYGITDPVGADLLRQVRRLADENRVTTSRITPDAEKSIGDLYEQAIEVTWEASLEPLVRFMYAVQMAGATLDIRQMTMTPSREDQLKGNLKIFFAYQRGQPEKPTGLTTEVTP